MHILIIEDEHSIAENIIYALETENFQTSHVSKGNDVPEMLGRHSFDLVILDIGLPDISGFDVFHTIRSRFPIPIIFLTARGSEIDQVLGLELGADDYVTKPFSPRALVARVRAILRRRLPDIPPKQTENPQLPSPPFLQHDPRSMCITYHGKALDLTAHEYKILATFLSQPGRTFTREQLLIHAWDDPCSVMDRTIDAHIKTLRAKLRAHSPAAADSIQTRRGLGYIFSPDNHTI